MFIVFDSYHYLLPGRSLLIHLVQSDGVEIGWRHASFFNLHSELVQ